MIKTRHVLQHLLLLTGIAISNLSALSAQQTLELTANTCFFGPKGTLRAVVDKNKEGNKYNNGTFLSHVDSWENENDTILWRVRLVKAGTLRVKPYMSISSAQQNSVITVNIEGKEQTINLKSGKDGFIPQAEVQFTIPHAGEYTVNLILKKKAKQGAVGELQKVLLSGKAAQNAEVMCVRWRPMAIHAKLQHTSHPNNVTIAVVEDVPVTKDIWMYHPVTTPFGYAGTAWSEEAQEFAGINFSLWSYGAKVKCPPVEELSHLIAVGKGLQFGGFNHEGTGVKPRGGSPYTGQKTDRAIVAVRMEPGIKYNTYYTYYLDPQTMDKWHLFGCGKQYNQKGKINYLTIGKFVEVVGPPAISRTGHRQRVLKTRGWCVTEDGQKLPLNEMVHGGNDQPEMTAKAWEVSDDYFVMKTGGFGGKAIAKGAVTLPDDRDMPSFLSDEMLKQLYLLPCEMQAETRPVKWQNNEATVQVTVNRLGTQAKATLYWGENDGVTFDDKEAGFLWKNKKNVEVKEGINYFVIPGLTRDRRCFWRLKVENNEGITWLKESECIDIENIK